MSSFLRSTADATKPEFTSADDRPKQRAASLIRDARSSSWVDDDTILVECWERKWSRWERLGKEWFVKVGEETK